MNRENLRELHFITPVANVPSILERGILCHAMAERVPHDSAAMAEIQARRARKRVPGGRPLHEYANLYFTARNPMLFKRSDHREQLCVLGVSPAILDLPGVVITDANASSDYVRFAASPAGLAIVDAGRTFAKWWTHPDKIEYLRRKSAKCAEVLVPECVGPHHLVRAYVCSDDARVAFEALGTGLPVAVDANLFFL
ncbi:MAG: hypothetical protein A2133_12175 [Actinobacteria bacterium RBG_16_64_13]|nr:MAG: hypothetical protein A2133_12175 [Actinobacteria bacterium RBG_16_64_13]